MSNTTTNSKEYKNLYITVPLFDRGRTLTRTYDLDQLVNLLDQIPYAIINIPLYAYRNEYTNNDQYRGNFIVGWIEGFNKKDNTFDICIMERFKDIIEKYDQDVIIYPRLKFIGKNVVSIVGLDFCEKRYYSVINR